jgi:hypothetical protein
MWVCLARHAVLLWSRVVPRVMPMVVDHHVLCVLQNDDGSAWSHMCSRQSVTQRPWKEHGARIQGQ